jgi:PAS domain S-box-containing protein
MDYSGLSLEQYVQDPTRPIHPHDIPSVMEKWLAGMAAGEPYEHEMRLRRVDGEYRWFLVRTVPLRDDRGSIVKWYGSSIDIEDSKRAEEALRKSEERWRSVFENSAIGVALTDLNGRFLATNPVYQKMVGHSEEELRKLSFPEITLEEYREANRAFITELLEGKRQQFQIEKQYRRKDGSLIWVRNSVSLVPGTESMPRFIMALSEDITERKRAEAELRRSEAYLAAGQRLSHTGSWALNLSSREIFWSQETYRIFGIDPASTTASLYEAFLQRIHPEDRSRIEKDIRAAAVTKNPYATDYRVILPDGSIRYIHDVVYPVVSEAGDVIERYGLAMDVTERKRTEVELQRSRDQLRALAARLQSVREEERTRVAREIHDELGQALTAIMIEVNSLSHELPADKKQQSESTLKLVEETIQSVRRISTELRPVILDAVGLVAAVEWAAEEFEVRTGTEVHLDLPQDKDVIDQRRDTVLFRIFQETLTNVARHANATDVNVRLTKEDGSVTLEVHDNGKGVREEQLSAGGSLGILGMQERALLLGGELTITGGPGKGTTVRVRIPETHPTEPKGDQ